VVEKGAGLQGAEDFIKASCFTAQMDPNLSNRIASVSRGGTVYGVSPTTRTLSGSYDPNGNLLSDGTHTLTYDALNRTVSTSTPSDGTNPQVLEKYFYDASGERAASLRYEAGAATPSSATYYARSGAAVAVEENVELDAAGLAVGAATKCYLYAGGNLAATEQTWSVSGRIVDGTGTGIAGVTVTVNGATVTTDSVGTYLLPGLGSGSYTVTPSKAGEYFNPPRRTVIVGTQAAVGEDFTGSASPYAPPGVPDGSAGQPLTAAKNGTDISVTWDASTCPAYAYAIVGGMGSDLPSAAGGGFQVSATASVCDAGFSGSYDWTNSPDPAQDSTRFEWFLVVARNETGTEGSWGVDSTTTERNGTGTGGSSGLACATGKDITNTCGSAFAAGGVYSEQETGMDGQLAQKTPTLQNPAVLYYA